MNRLAEMLATTALAVCLPAVRGAGAALPGDDAASQGSAAGGARGPFSAGLYGGELYTHTYLSALYAPTTVDLTSTYILAANIDYRLYRSPTLPLQFEMEFDVARHFGDARQYEGVIAPFLRWTAFPWNRHLYTNVRASALGVSYASGVSAFERQNSGQDRGSNLLQFGAVEIAFARHEDSPVEVFLRLHHRSGIYGLINGVDGGSTYLAAGFRVFR